MPFGRVIAVWMLLMLAETAHGWLRAIFIAPVLGDLRTRQVGVLIGCAIIFAITLATIRWMHTRTAGSQHLAGGIWVVLTLAFEITLGLAMNLGAARIVADYDPSRGGFMVLGLAFMFLAPRLAAKLRGV
jgi:ABC-type Mn2+/Zn2+ transport system permease subunit